MATMLRFDSAKIDGTSVTTAEFVSGSGRITYTGDDVAVTTADGKIHNDRRAKTFSAEFQMYGDGKAFETPVGLGVPVSFYRGTATTAIATFTAVVQSTYSANDRTSRISITADPTC